MVPELLAHTTVLVRKRLSTVPATTNKIISPKVHINNRKSKRNRMYYSILWLIFFVERFSINLGPNLTRSYGVHSHHVSRHVCQSFSCPLCTSSMSGWPKTRVTTPLPAQNLKVVAIPDPFSGFWLRHVLTISIHAGAVGATYNLLLTNQRRGGLFGGEGGNAYMCYYPIIRRWLIIQPPLRGIEDLLP